MQILYLGGVAFKKNTVPVAMKRTIEENCTALGVDEFGFKE